MTAKHCIGVLASSHCKRHARRQHPGDVRLPVPPAACPMGRKEQICAFRHVSRSHSREGQAIRIGSRRRRLRRRQESAYTLARVFRLVRMIAVCDGGRRGGGAQPALYRCIVRINLGYSKIVTNNACSRLGVDRSRVPIEGGQCMYASTPWCDGAETRSRGSDEPSISDSKKTGGL